MRQQELKKSSESQKSESSVVMKAAWDRSEDCYDPARQEDILGRTRTRMEICVKNTSKTRLWHWKKSVGMLGESLLGSAFGFTVCRCQSLASQWLAVVWVPKFCNICGKGPTRKASGLAWTHGTVVRLRASSSHWYDPGKYGPHSELFFFHMRNELVAPAQAVSFNHLSLRKSSSRAR